MKLLSDFDGVWTCAVDEAAAVLRLFRGEAARLAGVPADEAERDFAAFREVVLGAPDRHGWRHAGQLTAYVDEDPFCLSNTLGAFLADQAERGDERARTYRDGIVAGGFDGPEAFADHCFLAATATYREEHPPGLVPQAGGVVGALAELEAELVIVSNSPPEKILGWFEATGVEFDPARVRVRGSAGKHVLGDEGTTLDAAGRTVRVDRPGYRTILEDEQPDLVVGDVFSLDLALPDWLRRQGLRGAPARLALHRHDHTPAWAHELAAEGTIDHVVGCIDELPALLDAARAR